MQVLEKHPDNISFRNWMKNNAKPHFFYHDIPEKLGFFNDRLLGVLFRSNIRPENANYNFHEFHMHTFERFTSCNSCHMLLR